VCVLGSCLVAGAHGQGKPWLSPGSTVGEEIAGPDGGVLVWAPSGAFLMGASDEDIRYAAGRFREATAEGLGRDQPVHRVRISRGFWLGKHEVTNAQYRAFCQQTERTFPEASTDPDDHPVRGVIWDEAVAYCHRLGAVLPSEAQWEYAARGSEDRWYPWGDFWEASRCCYRDHKGPNGTTMPADSNPAGASWCGALNLAGNVMEWCADWYDSLYYLDSPEPDPTGPTTGEYRVLRGGCLGDLPWACRSAFRGNSSRPDERNYGIGFRICITP